MRTKIRTTRQLKPGMVVRSHLGGTAAGSYRMVATVTKPTAWAERLITFTDGTRELYSLAWDFDVARGKTQRNATKARAAIIPRFALADALNLLGGYAITAQG